MEISTDLLVVLIGLYTLGPAFALLAFLTYRRWKAKRRAEDKVRMSGRIDLSDIQTLAKSNSWLLADAVTLRCAQMNHGRGPGD